MKFEIFLIIISLTFYQFKLAVGLSEIKTGLNKFLKRYDKVVYEGPKYEPSGNLYLNITSRGKKFQLYLKPKEIHSNEIDLVEINENLEISKSDYLKTYDGYLVDDPENSYVDGIVIDNEFYGSITTPSMGNLYIESAKRYSKYINSNAIMYAEEDIKLDSLRSKRSTDGTQEHVGCGSADKIIDKKMKDEQEKIFRERRDLGDYSNYHEYYKYSKQANIPNFRKSKRSDNEESRNENELQNSTRLEFPDSRTVCNLYLKVDWVLYKQVFHNEGNKNPETTISYLLAFLNRHVQFLNKIYNDLPFFDAEKQRYFIGVQFMVHRTKIMTTDQCMDQSNITNKLSGDEKKLCDPYLDVSAFLNIVSLDDYKDYCLSYTFTARDFADGTLGLAWVAKSSGSVGGICEKPQVIHSVTKSLNTGIVTVINYQQVVTELVSQITFAHEVGHNFGAEHDPTDVPECSPGRNGGNYIMYRSATQGFEKNNKNFSECSKNQMGPIVHDLVRNIDKFCFKKYNGSLCGNGIIEAGEECDCGYRGECKDRCCYDASETDSKKRCKLRPKAECSPSQGPCCSNRCKFEPFTTVCLQDTDCLKKVHCTGLNSFCPINATQFHKPNLTTCNSGTQVCLNGACTGSICEKYSMSQCYLEGDLKDKNTDKSRLCHLACIGDQTGGKCMDSFEIPVIQNRSATNKGLILKPGSPCMGTLGYCDIFSKCRAVDAEGPLLRLKKFLLSTQTIDSVQTWIRDNWYIVIIAFGVFAIFTGLFIKVCSVHTPSSNPKRPPARKFSETLKRIPHRRNASGHLRSTNELELVHLERDSYPTRTANIQNKNLRR